MNKHTRTQKESVKYLVNLYSTYRDLKRKYIEFQYEKKNIFKLF
jgi:hypothetical protein